MPGLYRHGDAFVSVSGMVFALETIIISWDMLDINKLHKYIIVLWEMPWGHMMDYKWAQLAWEGSANMGFGGGQQTFGTEP